MTTIAWDGETLAAEVQARDGQRFLVAFAGSGDFAHAVLAWMRGTHGRPNALEFVKADDLQNQCALVIDEQRRIWQLSYQLVYTPSQERKVYAYGGGQEFAWGALEAGATAAQAVRIAIKRSDYAGLGVDTVRFA
jgi:hypothetical protein